MITLIGDSVNLGCASRVVERSRHRIISSRLPRAAFQADIFSHRWARSSGSRHPVPIFEVKENSINFHPVITDLLSALASRSCAPLQKAQEAPSASAVRRLNITEKERSSWAPT